MEKTFFIIKPDGVRRGLVGEVLQRIERRGFKLEALDMRMVTPELLTQHYEALVDRPFFPKIVDYMTSGPVIIGVFSGHETIASWRKMMGVTNPLEALPEQIGLKRIKCLCLLGQMERFETYLWHLFW